MKEQVESKTLYRFLSVVFFLSGITLTILLALRPIPAIYYVALFVLCSVVWGFVAFQYRIVEKSLGCCNKTDTILSTLLALAFIPTHYRSLNYLINILTVRMDTMPTSYEHYINLFISNKLLFLIPLITLGAFSLCIIFIYLSGRLRKPVIRFFKGLSGYESVFLIAGSIVCAVSIIVLFNITNVFYLPSTNETFVYFDAVYTFDTGSLLEKDCYVNPAAPENDLRQPLFGIFALPFGLAAKLVSFLIPSANANVYPICCNILQNILLLISLLLISRMLNVGKETKIYFLLLSVAAFPFMLFALNMEQYIFALFWAILLIYNSYTNRKINIPLSVAAAGSLMTSVLLIPPLMILNKEFTLIIKKGLSILMLFFALFICGGVIEIIYKLRFWITHYVGFLSQNGFIDKFQQFTRFIVSCFIAPCSQIIMKGDFISYDVCVNHSPAIFGIVIYGFSVLSGIIFRRNYIAVISLYWIGFALALICVLGWGTAENGTLLYSLYFFWAFTVLIVLLIDKLLTVSKYAKRLVFIILITALFVYNIYNMLDIINFGRMYYPAL